MNDDIEVLPHNGQEGQPCIHGCIMGKRNGQLHLIGDCRNPWGEKCKMREIDNERLRKDD